MRRVMDKPYEYLSTDMIINACSGDKEAMGQVVIRYRNYAVKCLRTAAESKYRLNLRQLPEEDLMQEAWMKLTQVVVKKFRAY